LKENTIPIDWAKGLIVKLPKKAILETVITGEVSHYSPYKAKCCMGKSVKIYF
jgi:hypothetical protein